MRRKFPGWAKGLMFVGSVACLIYTVNDVKSEANTKNCRQVYAYEAYELPCDQIGYLDIQEEQIALSTVAYETVETEETEEIKETEIVDYVPAYVLTEDEFELLARLVTAEAENQSFEAQYMVACVVMNRVESNLFPDSVYEVIWQEKPAHQFSSMWNGRYDRCSTTDSCYEAVEYLVENGIQYPADMMYFTSEGYLRNTVPYLQDGQMYFSRQKAEAEK